MRGPVRIREIASKVRQAFGGAVRRGRAEKTQTSAEAVLSILNQPMVLESQFQKIIVLKRMGREPDYKNIKNLPGQSVLRLTRKEPVPGGYVFQTYLGRSLGGGRIRFTHKMVQENVERKSRKYVKLEKPKEIVHGDIGIHDTVELIKK